MHVPRWLSLVVVVGVLAACGGDSRPASDTSLAARQLAAQSTLRNPPPKLPLRHEAMSDSAFAALIDALTFDALGSDTADHRVCQGLPENPGSGRCALAITPVTDAMLVSREDVSETGRILAKIENVGRADSGGPPLREDSLGIEPGQTVFWLARETGPGTYEAFLLDRSRRQVGRTRTFNRCPEHDEVNIATLARFQNCPRPMTGSARIISLWEQSGSRRTSHTTPPWITCGMGCCWSS
jgi:hypothetical protein